MHVCSEEFLINLRHLIFSKMADVSDNRFNVLRENDDVGDLDDSVSQAITTAVLAAVEDSKTVKGTPKTS